MHVAEYPNSKFSYNFSQIENIINIIFTVEQTNKFLVIVLTCWAKVTGINYVLNIYNYNKIFKAKKRGNGRWKLQWNKRKTVWKQIQDMSKYNKHLIIINKTWRCLNIFSHRLTAIKFINWYPILLKKHLFRKMRKLNMFTQQITI